MRLLRNGARDPAAVAPPCIDAPAYHARLPGYAPTPLREAPRLAAAWGVERVWFKDETERLGLPSFKILGASWAVERTLTPETATLVAATDGNHGRAVARVAAWRGLEARILVPAATARARIDAIAGEGAKVGVVDGTYDDAVAAAERVAHPPGRLLVSDAASPHVIDGYATLGAEIGAEPDVVVVPVGVGALAAAIARRFPRARVVGVEPESAACVLASLEAGEPVSVPLSHESAMAGLNCGTPSRAAWPDLRTGLWGVAAIEDEVARAGVEMLAEEGVAAGECGGAPVGAAAALLAAPLAGAKSVLAIITEGPTGG